MQDPGNKGRPGGPRLGNLGVACPEPGRSSVVEAAEGQRVGDGLA